MAKRDEGKATILLVEDEDMLRSLLKDLLIHKGYQVFDAANAAEALEIEEQGAEPDLLLTDVAMPGMNGEALAELLRQKRPKLKVILMSGYAGRSATAIQNSLSSGDVVFLQKPFRMTVLIEKVQELLA
jgi:two-component system, cell cycle sensor histidine kinase and response regulator CckA